MFHLPAARLSEVLQHPAQGTNGRHTRMSSSLEQAPALFENIPRRRGVERRVEDRRDLGHAIGIQNAKLLCQTLTRGRNQQPLAATWREGKSAILSLVSTRLMNSSSRWTAANIHCACTNWAWSMDLAVPFLTATYHDKEYIANVHPERENLRPCIVTMDHDFCVTQLVHEGAQPKGHGDDFKSHDLLVLMNNRVKTMQTRQTHTLQRAR